MKNIHLIPTDKPSKLSIIEGKLLLSKFVNWEKKPIDWEDGDGINQHIYITNDEEIKAGDCVIIEDVLLKNIKAIEIEMYVDAKKIILTTDQDLIKDGIQSIDDEFLEWFVKNPSCEEVKVDKVDIEQPKPLYSNGNHKGERIWLESYKIIIPKEEREQDYSKIREGLKKSIEGKEHFIQHFKNGGSVEDFKPLEEPKQETLEEAAEIDLTNLCYYDKRNPDCSVDDEDIEDHKKSLLKKNKTCACDNCFYGRSKLTEQLIWQQERMYSEEEVIELLQKALTHQDDGEIGNLITAQGEIRTANFYSWFEQFKKK